MYILRAFANIYIDNTIAILIIIKVLLSSHKFYASNQTIFFKSNTQSSCQATDTTMVDNIERLQESYQMVDHENLKNLWKTAFYNDNPLFVPRHLRMAVAELDEPMVS